MSYLRINVDHGPIVHKLENVQSGVRISKTEECSAAEGILVEEIELVHGPIWGVNFQPRECNEVARKLFM